MVRVKPGLAFDVGVRFKYCVQINICTLLAYFFLTIYFFILPLQILLLVVTLLPFLVSFIHTDVRATYGCTIEKNTNLWPSPRNNMQFGQHNKAVFPISSFSKQLNINYECSSRKTYVELI